MQSFSILGSDRIRSLHLWSGLILWLHVRTSAFSPAGIAAQRRSGEAYTQPEGTPAMTGTRSERVTDNKIALRGKSFIWPLSVTGLGQQPVFTLTSPYRGTPFGYISQPEKVQHETI